MASIPPGAAPKTQPNKSKSSASVAGSGKHGRSSAQVATASSMAQKLNAKQK